MKKNTNEAVQLLGARRFTKKCLSEEMVKIRLFSQLQILDVYDILVIGTQ